MTRRFTRILAALALLVGLTIPVGMWGQQTTWSHEFVSPEAVSNNSITVEGVIWSIATTVGAGSPTIDKGNSYSQYCLKFGTGKSNYFSNITFSTDYFNNFNVQSVTIQVLHNTSKSGTFTATQGDVTIGTSTNTIGTTWTNVTVNTNPGNGGTLSFSYSPDACAVNLHAITVTYTDGTQPTTYTVTYNGNSNTSGTVPTDNNAYGNGDNVTVLGNTGNLAKTGHTFSGWCLNAEGTGTVYGPNNTTTYSISSNTTFYAKWTLNTHNITMPTADAYGSYNASETSNVPYGNTVTLTFTPATGYENYVATWSVNGDAISGNTFSMPDEDVTITVNVAEMVDYATLPFVWLGGVKADFLALNGTSAHGLGNGYGDNNAPYRIQFDDTGDYIQVKTDSQPGKVTIGVKMIGGANTSTITIQGSADGETFTNVEELTISGAQNNVLNLETHNAFAATDRYVRMLFTKGSNVGVGPITIAEYVAPQEHTIEVTSVSNAEIIVFDATNPVDNNWVYLFEGVGNAQVLEGTPIAISVSANEGYTLESLVVNDVNHVADISGGVYTFTMPSENVTISATAVVHPLEATFIFNTDAGLQALGITIPETSQGINLTGMELVSGNVTMTSTDGGTPTRVWNSSGNTTLRVYKNGSLIFSVPQGYAITKIIVEGSALNLNELSNGVWTADSNPIRTVTLNNGNSGSVISTITVEYGCTLEISDNQWYLIASPVGDVAPTAVGNMTTGSYALYRFDQEGDTDGKEWINYKGTDDGFNLGFGKGYLYANENGCTLTFTGTPVPFSDNDNLNVLPLDYHEGADFAGYNLLGNPFNQKVYVDGWPYYVMNSDGDAIIEGHSGINPMQGFFVIADGEEEDEVVTLTLEPTGEKGASVALNVSRNRGNVIDRVRVRFGESRQLPKFQLFENSTKVYIPQNGKDYAVVRSEGQGELPVNFSASENGTYTLSMDVENMDMNYLHLIDNMTGMDIDLLQTPSYTFNATTRDYESRFRLVFAANNEDGVSTGSTAFAFFSNGSWIINNAGEATLQVVDLTGRILSSETVNGSVSKTINAVPGVYMLRLINGDNVNVQKIVVR